MVEDFDAIVLAGDRGPDDPLARHAGVAGKALVPVAGTPMLTRVLAVLAGWPRLRRLVLVAPDLPAYREAAAGVADSRRLTWLEPCASLSASVRAALASTAGAQRLVLTADHALLDRAWLDRMAEAGEPGDGFAMSIGLTDWHGVMRRFPGSRRTRYRFSDRSVCGTNLFAIHDDSVEALLEVWQRVERERKKPWKILSLLGWGNLGRYLAGRLELDAAFAALSVRVGVGVRPLLLSDPLTAVDVDSPADLALVESVAARMNQQTC